MASPALENASRLLVALLALAMVLALRGTLAEAKPSTGPYFDTSLNEFNNEVRPPSPFLPGGHERGLLPLSRFS